MTRKDFQGRTEMLKAAMKRLADAQVLLQNEKPHGQGAKYLGGYAVECKLKVIAMEIYDCWKLDELASKMKVTEQDIYTHGLKALARLLPLYQRLQQSDVWEDFNLVNQWRPSWRYNPEDVSPGEAQSFIESVKRVKNWLKANRG
jgi:hypothetical protein